jgi:capsular polysaccharide biosynthesis protein
VKEHEVDGTADDAREQVARLTAFCRRAVRFWRFPVVLVVVGAIVCAAFLTIRRPAYRSETVILYSEGVRSADDAERPDTSRSVTVRLREILMSRGALDAVVREFNLYPVVRETRGPVDAVEELRKHIEFRAPGGDTFSIAFTGDSPVQAQHVTARLAELVIGQDSDLRKKRALVTRDFLETEERRTEADLRDREQALASFMGAHPRFAFDMTPLATGAAIRASLGSSPTGAQPGAVAPRWRATSGAGDISASPSGAPTTTGGRDRVATAEEARATAALAAARANLAELASRFTPAHPDVRAAQAEVERATSRLATANTIAGPASQGETSSAPVVRAAEVTLPSVAPRPQPVFARPPVAGPTTVPSAGQPGVVALETEWVMLTRGVTEARQHQDQVEAALFKANIAASSESGGHGVQVTMIDSAFLPQNSLPPGRTMIAGIFAAISLLLGALGAIVRAGLDDRIHDVRDLSRVSEVLVEVPRASSRRAHVAS